MFQLRLTTVLFLLQTRASILKKVDTVHLKYIVSTCISVFSHTILFYLAHQPLESKLCKFAFIFCQFLRL